MASEAITYDRAELRRITSSFKAMDQEAIQQAREVSNQLATYASEKIKSAARTRTKAGEVARRVADGVSVSKTSKVGEFSYGFARQKFSGGGTTQILWPGIEFGSRRFKQFPSRSPNFGRGASGYFIYPTLRRIQPDIVRQWETAFAKIVKEFD
jgi:hypothetical protein